MSGAFIDEAFPVDLAYGGSVGPQFSTTITETAGGFEQRNANWSQAKVKLDAGTGVQQQSDLAKLIAHFRAAAGRWAGFRCRDWSDYSSAADGGEESITADDQVLIACYGDTTGKLWQLVKTYTAGGLQHVRKITRPVVGTVRISLNHVEQHEPAFSIDYSTGIVTFPSRIYLSVRAGFLFDVPMRYDSDTLSESMDDYLLGKASVPMVEIRE